MNTIETIRAEIERLKGQLIRGACAAQIEMEINCKDEAYNEILSFLDTLQEPVCERLEDVADTLAEEHGFVKKPDFKPPRFSWSAVRDVFIEGVLAGAKWDRSQMMEEAVEGRILGEIRNQENEPYEIYAESDVLPLNGKFKMGDKVKVIIIKEK